jgi:hypothetical protein
MTSINEIKELIESPDSVKVLGTVDPKGQVHTAVKQSFSVNSKGNLEYLELFESSRSYRNLVFSLWHEKLVSLSVLGAGGQSYRISGRPDRILVSGNKFELAYKKLLPKGYDLAAVIEIKAQTIEDETPDLKFKHQEEAHYFFKHLDRLSKD